MKNIYRILCLLPFFVQGSLANANNLESQDKSTAVLPPLMGWSSWNTYHVNINEELIKKQANALVGRGLKDAGYMYINVDDGFFGYRDDKGKMHAHSQRFPNGMRVISDYIHSLGLKAGIYSDAGDNTCGSIYDNDANGVGSGLYGHEQQDMNLYLKEWNFDFIKIDYCGARNLGLEEEKRYSTICDAITATGRDDVSINICRWAFPGTWAKRLARSWRVSPDIRPRWSSLKNILELNMYLSAYAGDGHYNDMDMLEIGRGLSRAEEETHFGMWCIMSSPLLIGCDLTKISDESLKLLKNKELIALNQDKLGLQAYVAKRDNDCYVLVKDIERRRGLTRAVALYNSSDSVYTFNVPLQTLELAGTVKVRDLMHGKNLGKVKDELKYTVAAHSVLICKLQAEKRLEPTEYEAEWAYLPCYDYLLKNPKRILYANSQNCSGAMKVHYLGGSKENYAEWKDVYSDKGGEYLMKIDYCSPTNSNLELFVNGEKYVLSKLNSGGSDKVATAELLISLTPGYNDIRMGNSFSWAPDIDKFTLMKASKK